MRLRHKGNGVIVNVDDETGDRMLGGVWRPADEVSMPEGEPDASWRVADLIAYAREHEIELGEATKKADVLAVIDVARHAEGPSGENGSGHDPAE